MCCNDGWRRVCVSARGDKSQIMSAGEGRERVGEGGSQDREKRIGPDPTNDKGNQSMWERFGRRKVLFPPGAVGSQGSATGQEHDP